MGIKLFCQCYRYFISLTIGGLLLLLNSCSPISLPVTNTYTLSNAYKPAVASTTSSLSIFVSNPSAVPGYQTSKIVYCNNPYEIKYFSKNRWIAPPAQMLLPLIAESLQNTHRFAAVVIPPFAGSTDLRLDVTLLKLQQKFLDNIHQSSVLELSMRAQLINLHNNQPIATTQFALNQKIASTKLYDVVKTANQVVTQALQQIALFCITQAK